MNLIHYKHDNEIHYKNITEQEEFTAPITTNFESRYGTKAWYCVSKPQRQDFIHGQEVENWQNVVEQYLETMLENTVKPLGIEKMRSCLEVRTPEGMFVFNLDFWYDKPEQKKEQLPDTDPDTWKDTADSKRQQNNLTAPNTTQQPQQNKSIYTKYNQDKNAFQGRK